MNPSPYTIHNTMPVSQTFSLFRGLGLRHLPVIDQVGVVVGIITRHDLTEEKLESVLDNLHNSNFE